ncbi:MAG TPA: triose-phosphate isomerase, partial [Deltaproteobacteria bacterium]|nr:triose-phosphate isomerase [Deltaproteobacteria bacterium]
VWAIGTGKNAAPEQAGEAHHFIRNWLTKYYDAPTANRIRLLYGGSVKPENASLLMKETHVDGLLVGGASLDAEAFAGIVKFEERIH